MSDDHNIESWDELGERISKLGLHIEDGAANWVSRIIDHADKLKAERDAAEAKLAWAVGELEEMFMIQNSEAAYGILRVYTKALLAELKGQDDE